jgi:hypothetical protein
VIAALDRGGVDQLARHAGFRVTQGDSLRYEEAPFNTYPSTLHSS